MTCSLKAPLGCYILPLFPFPCVPFREKKCRSNQTSLPTTFPVLKIYCVVLPVTKPPRWENPTTTKSTKAVRKSHVLFIGTTCFHMGTIATGQACYFAEGDSSFLKKNCGQTALMGCSWCPSCLYIGPTKKKTLSSLFCRVSSYPMHGGSRFLYRSCLYLTYLSLPCVYHMLFYPLSCKLLVQLILPRHLLCDLLIFPFVVSIRIYLHTQEPEAVTTKLISVSKN